MVQYVRTVLYQYQRNSTPLLLSFTIMIQQPEPVIQSFLSLSYLFSFQPSRLFSIRSSNRKKLRDKWLTCVYVMSKLVSDVTRVEKLRNLENDELLRLAEEEGGLDKAQLREVVAILGERVKMSENDKGVIRLTKNLSMQTELGKALHELVVGAAILTKAEVSTLFLVNVEKQTLEVAASVYFDPTKMTKSMKKPDASCFGLDQGVIGLTMDIVSLVLKDRGCPKCLCVVEVAERGKRESFTCFLTSAAYRNNL